MDWNIDIDHAAAMATTDYVLRAIKTQGSVLLDPQTTVTLALAYRHARFNHEFVEDPMGNAHCTCDNWFFTSAIVSPYHDERQRISFEEHVATGRHLNGAELHERMQEKSHE